MNVNKYFIFLGGDLFERVAAPDYKLTEEKIQIFMRQIIKGNRYPDVLTFSFSYSDHIKLSDMFSLC